MTNGGEVLCRRHNEYASEGIRIMKSLSAENRDDLLNGRGWSLARPAELNGVPGPAHLLEMKSEISLSSEQVSANDSPVHTLSRDSQL